MKSTRLLLSWIACAAVALPCWPQALNPVSDDDRANFEQDFGEKLDQVKKTRTAVDDRQLAIEMIEFAGKIPDSPGIRCLLYIEAIPLASAGGDITTAVFAADRLGMIWPGHEATDPAKLIPDAERAYRLSSGDERDRIAEPYIDLLLSAARRSELENDLEQAIRLCRDANLVARKVESDRREHIEDTLARLSQAADDLNEIRQLSQAVQANPKNAQAARELIRLLVTRRDDPRAAAAFADNADDPDTAEALMLCSAGVRQASGPAALFVGDWYMTLADNEENDYARPLLEHALRWYARFQAVYPREDALAKRVAVRIEVARARLERIHDAQRAAQRGQWIDLIATMYKPADHAIGESIDLVNHEIVMDGGGFVMPLAPRGSFELRVRMTMHEQTPGLTLFLPVGENRQGAALFHYAINDNTMSAIEGVGEQDTRKSSANTPGRPVELIFQAAVMPDDQLGLAMLIDGQESLKWVGPARRVRINNEAYPLKEHGRVIYFTCKGKATFHRIELRERE